MSEQNIESETQLSNNANSNNTDEKLDSSEQGEVFGSLEDFSIYKFEFPTKRISNGAHLSTFLQSPAFDKLDTFIKGLATSVEGQKISDPCHMSSTTKKVLKLLDSLNKLVDDVPPIEQQSRYGNKAYRTWHEELAKISKKLLLSLLPDSWNNKNNNNNNTTNNNNNSNDQTTFSGSVQTTSKNTDTATATTNENKDTEMVSTTDTKTQENNNNNNNSALDGLLDELNGYLLASFGDSTRIDYGTGHELTFICFLTILKELKLFKEEDYCAIVLRIFHKYLILMRKIQSTYLLEPAGSRGVWGLDDYQFLAFYFGASQLINHKTIFPKNALNRTILRVMSHEFLYLECVAFIYKMKTGVFAEHSPLLNDITAVENWRKVKSGLYKMYMDDVFKKFPVIQHFLFGSVLSINLDPVKENDPTEDAAYQRKLALINKLNKERGVTDDRSHILSPDTNVNTNESMAHFGTGGFGSGSTGSGGVGGGATGVDVSKIDGSMSVHYASMASGSGTGTGASDAKTGSISALRKLHAAHDHQNPQATMGTRAPCASQPSQSKPISLTAAPWAVGKKTTAVVGPPMPSSANSNDKTGSNSNASGSNSNHVMTKAPWA